MPKVPSHVESKKKKKDARGRLGVDWTKDEWGNWIADRVATHDLEALKCQGIRCHMLKVPAKSIYSKLLYSGRWYIGDRLGVPALPRGAKEMIQANLHNQYLSERDVYRTNRGDSAI